jgi:hypothetical protein
MSPAHSQVLSPPSIAHISNPRASSNPVQSNIVSHVGGGGLLFRSHQSPSSMSQ